MTMNAIQSSGEPELSDTAFLALAIGSLNIGLISLAAAIFRAAKVYADSYEDDE